MREASRRKFLESASERFSETRLGAGPWERLSQKPFWEILSSKSSGNAFGAAFQEAPRESVLERDSRNLLRKSASEKCLGDAVRGRFSEGHRENRFGSVFREDFQKNVSKKSLASPK